MTSADVARLVLGYLSDKGLQQTKAAFCSECLDLGYDGSSDLMNGQKLSLIIEEYFVLKGHDKRTKRDPQSILLLLWKQFDVLVGQLKHSTIHAKEKAKAGTGVPQKIRVRELNRQNRASLQKRKLNTVFIPNHDLLKVQHIKCETVKPHQGFTPPPQRLENAIGVQGKPDSRLPFNNVCTTADTFQPSSIPNDNFQLVPVVQCDVVQRNTLAENVEVVMSSHSNSMGGVGTPLSHSMGSETPLPKNQLLLGDQFRSPKRKSVQPKRHPVVAEAALKSPSAQHSVIIPAVDHPSPDEQQLDLSSLVEKILGQPEFSEKLAENINRAVEMDTPTDHKEPKEKDNSTGTQGAVVDSVKIDNIMEMMTADPAFEGLFSSFESFTNSCEENDLERNQSEEHVDETNPTKSISKKGNCASVATDALLLLASSPAKSSSKQDDSSDSLNTPTKNIHSVSQKLPQGLDQTGAVFRPPCSPALSSVPVVISPGKAKSPTNRAAQPIFSHVRQLDFSSVGNASGVSNSGGKSSGNCTSICSETTVVAADSAHCLTSTTNVTKNSGQEQETTADKRDFDQRNRTQEGVSVAGGQKNLDASPSLQENAQANYRRNVVGYKNILQCSQLVCSENDSREEEEDEEPGKGNDLKISSSDTEESSLSVLEELATHIFTQRKESAQETESKDCLLLDSRDRKGDRKENKEQCGVPRRELTSPESTMTEEEHGGKTLLTEGLTSPTESCSSFTDGFTSIKQSTPGGFSHKNVVSKAEIFNPSNPSDPTVSEDSGGCLGKKRVNEESEGLLQKVNQRTPLTNVTGSTQVPKRKLKKNKKSSAMTKKRKTLPADLDVDKFLSRLHYVEKDT